MSDGIELATAYVSLVSNTKGLGASLTRDLTGAGERAGAEGGGRFSRLFRRGSSSAAQGMQSTIGATIKKLAIAAGGIFAVKKIIGGLTGTANAYKSIVGESVKLRRYMGGTIQDASRFRFVAQQAGIDVDKMARGLGIFNKGLASGKIDGYAASLKAGATHMKDTAKAQAKLATAEQKLADLRARQKESGALGAGDFQARRDAIKAVAEAQANLNAVEKSGVKASGEILGVKTRDLKGNLLPMAKLLPQLADKFKNMADGPEKTAAAMKLFGRAGADLLPLLNKGAGGVDELMKKADELGVTMSEKDVKAMKEANANSRLFHAGLQGVQVQIGRYVLPVLTKLMGFLAARMPRAVEITRQVVARLRVGFAALGDWWAQHGPAIMAVVRRVFDGIVTAVAAVVLYVQQHWPQIKATIATVIATVRATIESFVARVQSIWEKFGGNIIAFARRAWNPIREIVSGAMTFIRGVIEVVTAVIQGKWGRAWDGIKKVVSGAWDVIKGVVRLALDAISNLFSIGWKAVKNAWGVAWRWAKNFATNALFSVLEFVRKLPGRIKSALVNLGEIILAPWKWAFKLVAKLWNATIGKLSFKVPSWVPGFGGKGFSFPTIDETLFDDKPSSGKGSTPTVAQHTPPKGIRSLATVPTKAAPSAAGSGLHISGPVTFGDNSRNTIRDLRVWTMSEAQKVASA